MEEGMGFEAEWPALEKKLRVALGGRRVPIDLRDDIVQETGLRLFRTWSSVRPESAWSFALTIAINLVRDEARRRERQDPSRLELPSHHRDAEQDALVRIELQRVSDALASMSERQRSILLAEIGEEALEESNAAALKMARMRARKRLRVMLEQVSGLVLGGLDRLRRLLGGGEGMVAGAFSSVGRPAAVAGIAIAGLFGGYGPDAAAIFGPHGAREGRTITVGATAEHGMWVNGVARHARLRGGRVPSLPAKGRVATASEAPNQNFGPIRNSNEGIVIDPDNSNFGPYEAEQEVAPSTFGENETSVGVSARHEGAECGSSDSTSGCTGMGRASATVTVTAGGETHEVTVGSERAIAYRGPH